MKQNNKVHILWRYAFISFFIVIFSVAIIAKLVGTTVVDASKWNMRAEQSLSKVDTIEPERGKILSDNGSVLAANLNFYTARIDWGTDWLNQHKKEFYDSLPKLADSLAAMDDSRSKKEWMKELTAQMKATKKKRYYRLMSGLSYSQFMRLKDFPFFNKAGNKCGLYSEISMRRCKPFGSMASRSIGGVGKLPGKRGMHGISGLERALDTLLYGVPGMTEKIQLPTRISNWEKVPAQHGYDIMTTINVDLQDIVEQELYNMLKETNATWGTVVLMEVSTGEIKAISNLEWKDQFNDYVEGRNNAVLGYEPGSVMKPISMMVALENGLVNNIDSVIATGATFAYAGGKPIHDCHGMASMPVRQVIESSSNVGMAKIILHGFEKDPGQFYHCLHKMGFFDPLHTGIAGEEIPDIDSLGTKNWDRIALSRMCFGYSTRIPPMCTLAMYNAIANDGKYVRPRLVKQLMMNGVVDSVFPVSYIRKQVCSPKNAEKLRIMLHDVVWGKFGTGKALQDDKVEIAGKTGTCYTIAGKSSTDTHASYSSTKRLAFCGFFPYSHPKYSCIVLMLGANKGAALSSGMVLKNIALKMYSRGLLGNVSDYHAADADQPQIEHSSGILCATSNPETIASLKSDLGMSGAKKLAAPKSAGRGVPNVFGLDIRDAILRLETAGLTVRFTGSGLVCQQSIAPGSGYRRGQVIVLNLKH
jgi:cell division protein FtsI (penicillin-binding protein 3)